MFRRFWRWLGSCPLADLEPDRCELYPRVFVPMGQRRAAQFGERAARGSTPRSVPEQFGLSTGPSRAFTDSP